MEKLFKSAVIKIAELTSNHKSDKKNLGLSVVSLFVATAVLVTATLCWYSMVGGTADSGKITVNAGNGLTLNGSAGSSTVRISNDVVLTPASSVDGYNLYLPSDGNFYTVSGNTKVMNTENMIFRRANAGDKNSHYIQVDFTVEAQAADTDIYLNENSSVVIQDSNGTTLDNSAIRIAVISGLAETPVIVNPTDEDITVEAVSDISYFTGVFAKAENQKSLGMKKESQNIISLEKGKTSNISLIIWLEGTDSACTETSLPGSSLDITLNLSSSLVTE